MKMNYYWLVIGTASVGLLLSACSQQEPASKTATDPAPSESPAKAASVPETPKTTTPPSAPETAKQDTAPAPVTPVPAPVTPVVENPPLPPAVTPPPAPSVTTPAPAPSLLSATNAAQLLEAQKLALGQTATSQVQSATAAATNQVQALIEKAKSLTSNQKYQEALGVVQQLSATKLTPTQQQTVDGLKAQIQAEIAKRTTADPSSVIGNILGGKK